MREYELNTRVKITHGQYEGEVGEVFTGGMNLSYLIVRLKTGELVKVLKEYVEPIEDESECEELITLTRSEFKNVMGKVSDPELYKGKSSDPTSSVLISTVALMLGQLIEKELFDVEG